MYENLHQKNTISKTSNLSFGQNYKKIIASSKASMDFKKSIFRSNLTKPPSVPDDLKRTPLGQLSQNVLTNNIFQAKSFKIRTYNKRTKENQNDFVMCMNKELRFRLKSIDLRQQPLKTFLPKQKSKIKNLQQKHVIKMQQFDNYETLECISKNIKIYYNPQTDLTQDGRRSNQKTFILSINYLVHIYKTMNKGQNYSRVSAITQIVRDLSCLFQQKLQQETLVKLCFKAKDVDELHELRQICDQMDFHNYYCIFYCQQTFVQRYSVYNLLKLESLSQNIVIFDDRQSLSNSFPLLDQNHLISFVCLQQKCHSQSFLENLFVNASFKKCGVKNAGAGQLEIQLPKNQLKQKIKLKYFRKNIKRFSRQKRCRSSYEQQRPNSSLGNLQNFKQKMLKYIKILQEQKRINVNRPKVQKTNQIGNECIISGRGTSKCQSKTSNQIIAELLKLNCGVQKQIQSYGKLINGLQFEQEQNSMNLGQLQIRLKSPIIYLQTLN